MKKHFRMVIGSVCFMALAVACTTDAAPESPLGAGPDEPQYIRLSWNDDPSTTAALIWYTENRQVERPGVEYGTTAEFGSFVTAETFSLTGFDGALHQATLTGLTPGSLIHYRVGSQSGVSPAYTLATAAPREADVPFSFVLLGDSRGDVFGVGTGYPELNERILQESPLPAFILDTGDYTMLGQVSEWYEWLQASDAVGPVIPRLTTFGNHEYVERTYYGLMNLPAENDGQFYAIEYGPLQIISMNTGFGRDRMPEGQKEWLEKTLRESDATWRVAFMHIPPFNSGNHSHENTALAAGRLDVRAEWTPLFEEYGVDLVVGGHDHNYQRFGHIKAGENVTGGAPFYVISGGAGAPLYPINESAADYPLLQNGVYKDVEHYLVATLDGNELTVQAKKLDGTVFDTFTITK